MLSGESDFSPSVAKRFRASCREVNSRLRRSSRELLEHFLFCASQPSAALSHFLSPQTYLLCFYRLSPRSPVIGPPMRDHMKARQPKTTRLFLSRFRNVSLTESPSSSLVSFFLSFSLGSLSLLEVFTWLSSRFDAQFFLSAVKSFALHALSPPSTSLASSSASIVSFSLSGPHCRSRLLTFVRIVYPPRLSLSLLSISFLSLPFSRSFLSLCLRHTPSSCSASVTPCRPARDPPRKAYAPLLRLWRLQRRRQTASQTRAEELHARLRSS